MKDILGVRLTPDNNMRIDRELIKSGQPIRGNWEGRGAIVDKAMDMFLNDFSLLFRRIDNFDGILNKNTIIRYERQYIAMEDSTLKFNEVTLTKGNYSLLFRLGRRDSVMNIMLRYYFTKKYLIEQGENLKSMEDQLIDLNNKIVECKKKLEEKTKEYSVLMASIGDSPNRGDNNEDTV